MLIATLPTVVSDTSLMLVEKILSNPLISAARYNTGGATPFAPERVLSLLSPLARTYKKKLFVDLEGRQVRIAKWVPFDRGRVELNRDVSISLPGKIHFRGVGWCDITGVDSKSRAVYFVPEKSMRDYYLGDSQSVHIIARSFSVDGYLGGDDENYIRAAESAGIRSFMLSFVESKEDVQAFFETYKQYYPCMPCGEDLILKIESFRGMDMVRSLSRRMCRGFRLMAARDDLFLAYRDSKADFLDALQLIVAKDKNAIVASRILSSVEATGEVSFADIADIALLGSYGYRHFMLSDGMAHCFQDAMNAWKTVVVPLLGKL